MANTTAITTPNAPATRTHDGPLRGAFFVPTRRHPSRQFRYEGNLLVLLSTG
jgi:hypothetical protein